MTAAAADCLVIGATGRVGGEVVNALAARGVPTRVLLRSASKAQFLPEGVEVAVGDLGDRASLECALAGVSSVFFVTPHDHRDLQWGLNVLAACEAAEVHNVVLSTVFHPDAGNRWARKAIYAGLNRFLPHYKGKWQVEQRLRESRLAPRILLPSNFFQNDGLYREAILDEGVYPQPIGLKPVNRVDCRDIGEAAARALMGILPPGAYPLVGPDHWTGPDCARAWSQALGRTVTYAGNDIPAWRSRLERHLSPRELDDFAKTYAFMQRLGARAARRHVERAAYAMGRQPTPYPDYIGHQLEQWRSRPSTST